MFQSLRAKAATAALTALLGAGIVQAAPSYTMSQFDVAGASSWDLYDINNSNVMVGNATLGGVSQGYVVNGGSISFMSGPTGSIGNSALGLSDSGLIVGAYYNTMVDDGTGTMVTGPQKGYFFDGSYHDILVPGANETVVRAISPNGRYLTGYAVFDDGFHGFIYDRTTDTYEDIVTGFLVVIGSVDDSGKVVGSRRWRDGPGLPIQRASFEYQAGSLSYFNLAGQTDTRARVFNESGLLGGWVSNAGVVSAFLGSVSDYALFDWVGSTATFVEGLNQVGTAVGFYSDADGNSHALIFSAAVPEPVSIVLALGGLGLLAGARRRRQA